MCAAWYLSFNAISGHGMFEFTHDEYYVLENATVARVYVTRLGGGFGLTTVDYVSFSGAICAELVLGAAAARICMRLTD